MACSLQIAVPAGDWLSRHTVDIEDYEVPSEVEVVVDFGMAPTDCSVHSHHPSAGTKSAETAPLKTTQWDSPKASPIFPGEGKPRCY